jgi:N-methylhydantoinase A
MAKIVGIDVGGTFTDLVLLDEQAGRLLALKVPSTPHDQSEGFMAALAATGESVSDLGDVFHGSTVGLNAAIERRGAECVLLATRGFRDILELRRRDRPNTYGLTGFFEPLITRDHRFEVDERVDPQGNVLEPVSEAGVIEFLGQVPMGSAAVVVVAFLHSYANTVNERKAGEIINRERPDLHVVLSSDVLPEIREFERTSTAVLNGYIQPVVARYLGSLQNRLARQGHQGSVMVLQCNGGVMSADNAVARPVQTLFSGPAGGVVAGAAIAGAAGYPHAICCDMGGTSFDVSLIYDGAASYIEERKIEYGIPMRIPSIDITSVGAGGGSIAWIDRAGLLQVGPRSAGAIPGPACYGAGGLEPTVTDANLILGRIDGGKPIAGEAGFRLETELAARAMQERVGEPLGMSAHEAANAVIEVVNSNMASAIRVISVERGYDPRDFVLVAFGGAGPLHAIALARELGIPRVLVPYYPGVTSALGCVMADLRHDFVQTVNEPLEDMDLASMSAVLGRQRSEGEALLASERVAVNEVQAIHEASMGYEGQIHTVRVPLPSQSPSRQELAGAFGRVYQATYGYSLDYPVRLLNLRTAVVGVRQKPQVEQLGVSLPNGALSEVPLTLRKVYVGGTEADCPVYSRGALPLGFRFNGPAVVEQRDTTTWVEPGSAASVDEAGNLIVEVG